MLLLTSYKIAYATNIAYAAETSELDTLKNHADTLTQVLTSLKKDISTTDKIRLSAIKHGVGESIALNIACVESFYEAKTTNPNSTAGGIYQFLDGTWKGYAKEFWGTTEGRNKFNEDDNIELAMQVISKYGTRDWNASKLSGYGGGWANKPVERGLCSEESI